MAPQVSFLIPVKNGSSQFLNTVQQVHTYLNKHFSSFEILLIPNPDPKDPTDLSIEICRSMSRNFSNVQACHHNGPVGKGSALRSGFFASKGEWIFFTDADLPYDLRFFDEASEKLKSGFDLVTGNRRVPQSLFQVPVTLLPLAYGRHRLGLWFNQLVRLLLPITTTDTQAGIKAFTRRLAQEAFARQTAMGFLFDVELFLTAHAFNYQQVDLPITLYLHSEKSTVRILRECIAVAQGLTRMTLLNQKRWYHPSASPSLPNHSSMESNS